MHGVFDDTPTRVGATCLMQAVRRASRTITARYEAALEPAGLSAGQFTLLTALAVAPAESKAAIGRRIGADRTTVSRLIRPLQRRGLIGPGERAGSLSLTEAGRAVYDQALPLWHTAQSETLDRLGSSDPDALLTILGRL